MQPIAGLQLTLDFGDGAAMAPRGEETGAGRASIVLLAADEAGYLNLMHLASRAWLDPEPGDAPHVTLARLRGPHGRPDRAHRRPGRPARPRLRRWRGPSRRLRRGRTARSAVSRPALCRDPAPRPRDASARPSRASSISPIAASLPLVATNEPYFADAADYEAHDALLCIAEGAVIGDGARRQLSPEHRFKTRAEMLALFRRSAGGDAQHRSRSRCAAPTGRRRASRILPRFSASGDARRGGRAAAPRGRGGSEAPHRARMGWRRGFPSDDYRARLAFELDVIIKMKFPGYFLIVADFIKYAKAQGIPVGPGRGSGAGSLVAYALTITDLDPIRFGLLFERFLNPERVSMPDFDIDFCQDRRDEVIAYVREPLWRGQGRADHHLRLVSGARRDAQCRARARNAARPGRQARQAGAAKSRRARSASNRRSRASRG